MCISNYFYSSFADMISYTVVNADPSLLFRLASFSVEQDFSDLFRQGTDILIYPLINIT